MPLSIDKLINLLGKQKLVPVMYFKMMGTCAFIKVLCFENSEEYLLYIQSKYEIKLPKDIPNVYKLKDIDLDERGDISQRYGEQNDEDEDEILLDNSEFGGLGDESIEKRLQRGYKKDIICDDKIEKDFPDLRSINRQLDRLRLSLTNVRYKVGILYKNYLCVINRNDEIDFFSIKKFGKEMSNNRSLLIHFDLELFYENQESLLYDINQMRTGIFKNLDKNQIVQINSLNKILKNKDNINSIVSKLLQIKSDTRKKLDENKSLLTKLNENCREIISKNQELNEIRNSNRGNLTDETTYFKLKEKNDQKLLKAESMRKNLQEKIIELSGKHNDLTLLLEETSFDNVVMLDRILTNLNLLSQKCKDLL